jgi:hypothetical protein
MNTERGWQGNGNVSWYAEDLVIAISDRRSSYTSGQNSKATMPSVEGLESHRTTGRITSVKVPMLSAAEHQESASAHDSACAVAGVLRTRYLRFGTYLGVLRSVRSQSDYEMRKRLRQLDCRHGLLWVFALRDFASSMLLAVSA